MQSRVFVVKWTLQYLHFGYIITETLSGIDDNDTMKVFGKGGADVERNKPGDLYVTIKVPFLSPPLVDANYCPQFSQYYFAGSYKKVKREI